MICEAYLHQAYKPSAIGSMPYRTHEKEITTIGVCDVMVLMETTQGLQIVKTSFTDPYGGLKLTKGFTSRVSGRVHPSISPSYPNDHRYKLEFWHVSQA